MPYIHKGKEIAETPPNGEKLRLFPRRIHFSDDIVIGETLYLFREDSKPGAKDGGLIARGEILAAERSGKDCSVEVRFDGVAPKVPLPTRRLEAFTNRGGLGTGPFAMPMLTEIAEVWRNTTHHPIHRIGPEAGAWLDLYHFQN